MLTRVPAHILPPSVYKLATRYVGRLTVFSLLIVIKTSLSQCYNLIESVHPLWDLPRFFFLSAVGECDSLLD